MSIFKRYDPTHRLAKSLAALATVRKERAEKVAKGEERRARVKALIESGAHEDTAKIQEVTNLHVQLQMLEPALRRDDEREREALQVVARELRAVQAALSGAVTQINQALLDGMANKLGGLCENERDQEVLRKALGNFVEGYELGQGLGISVRFFSTPTLEIVEEESQTSLRDYRRLLSVIKRGADFLPSTFNPFPGTDSEMDALVPAPAVPEPFVPEPFAERTVSPIIAEAQRRRAGAPSNVS